jgi:hypothetical protein
LLLLLLLLLPVILLSLVILRLLLLLAFRDPFRSGGPDGSNPAGAARTDARRFPTAQDVPSENSRPARGPGARSAEGAQAGRAFFWLSFLCTSKEK